LIAFSTIFVTILFKFTDKVTTEPAKLEERLQNCMQRSVAGSRIRRPLTHHRISGFLTL
jgi:hypothetical protein